MKDLVFLLPVDVPNRNGDVFTKQALIEGLKNYGIYLAHKDKEKHERKDGKIDRQLCCSPREEVETVQAKLEVSDAQAEAVCQEVHGKSSIDGRRGG